MKTLSIFILTIVLFSSCTSKAPPIRAFVEAKLKDTLRERGSYEFVSLSRLTPIFRPYSTTEEYKHIIYRLGKAGTCYDEASDEGAESLDEYIDSLELCYTKSNIKERREPFGYYCFLKYKIKNKHGKTMLISRVVFVDYHLTTISIEDFSNNPYRLPLGVMLKSSIKFFYMKCSYYSIAN